MYFSLTQTDQLLVHLQSFSTNAVHYNVPESVKNGVPLFYLPQPTSIEPSLNIILLMYFSLTQTDQLLVHLQSFSTNAVHYNVPESVKNGVPLFYLPQPTSIEPSLNIILLMYFSLTQTDQLLVHLQSFSTNAIHYNVPESVKNGVPLFYLLQPFSLVPSLNFILSIYFSLTHKDQLLVHLQSFSTNAVHYSVPESVKNGVPLFYLPQPTSLEPSHNIILLIYFSLTQTDQLLVHLQSFSTNAVHYNVPESVKNGVPLFYLPQPTSIEPSLNIILLMYFSLTQTDQLLVHLQSFSTNAVHYNVPESVKNGVPLFYLPQPTSIEPSLNIILLIYFSLTQTDQLLVHLQSFSTNAVHYNVPESVKNGVPLFYLPQPTSLEPSLNIILLIYFSLTQTDQLLVHLQSFSTNAVHYNVPESVKNGVPLFYLPQPTSIVPSLNIIWASLPDNLSSRIWEQHRRRPACASAQSDQHLCYSHLGKCHM